MRTKILCNETRSSRSGRRACDEKRPRACAFALQSPMDDVNAPDAQRSSTPPAVFTWVPDFDEGHGGASTRADEHEPACVHAVCMCFRA